MNVWFVILLLATAAGEKPYGEAYRHALKQKVPLVVLVGAEWCGPCQQMKRTLRGLDLSKVAYAEVDVDKQRRLARAMMSGNYVPQLVIYVRVKGKPYRWRYIGARKASSVRTYLEQAMKWKGK